MDSWEELCKEYDKTIPEKMDLLFHLVDVAQKSSSKENLQALRLVVHKLAGNAGLYGYPVVSSLCKEFEQEILKAIEQKGPFSGDEYCQKIHKQFARKTQVEGLTNKILSNTLANITARKTKIGLIGLGYTGLSLVQAFGKGKFSLLGYDRDAEKIALLEVGKFYYNFTDCPELATWIKSGQLQVSAEASILEQADVIIVSVTTSLDRHKVPEITSLYEAFHAIASYIKEGSLIILQSTTYPGTTSQELCPILEQASKKQVGKDFFLAYVPEISDPGNLAYSFTDIPRIIGGVTPSCLRAAEALYREIGCKTVSCPSVEVAEAAKLLQNTYRLVNISWINEMKMMFDRMGIDIWEVIQAAAVKPFGFTAFYPSPGVGGDCIAVVPAYLSWKAEETDGSTSFIDLAIKINASMPYYVMEKIIQALDSREKNLHSAKILVLGAAYKKDVNDLRESASVKLLFLLHKRAGHVDYHDPYIPVLAHLADYPELSLSSVPFNPKICASYDAIVIATDHSFYDWKEIARFSSLIIDTRNVMSGIAEALGKTVKA